MQMVEGVSIWDLPLLPNEEMVNVRYFGMNLCHFNLLLAQSASELAIEELVEVWKGQACEAQGLLEDSELIIVEIVGFG